MVNTSRLEASDRVTLLMSFVPYLLEHGPVSVDDLAQHFDITTTQVEELVQLLAMSGIPGDCGLMSGSKLPLSFLQEKLRHSLQVFNTFPG